MSDRPREGGGRRWEWAFRRRPAVYAVMAVYALASTILMAVHAVGLTAEHALLIVLVLFTAFAPARAFVWDWLPFLFVGVMFTDLGAFLGSIAPKAHASQPVVIEQALFGGQVSVLWLQAHLHVPGTLRWYDVGLAAVYLSHFAAPIVAGLWLWFRHRRYFGAFVAAYMTVMAAGFLVHLTYPQTPPWLAAREGYLPPVERIVVSVLDHLNGFGHLYAGADPEPNGSMPALHMTIPVLITCFVIALSRRRRRLSLLWLLYPLTMGFAVVYLGEHYVLDVLAGSLLGLLAFAVSFTIAQRRTPAVEELAPQKLPLVIEVTGHVTPAEPASRR